MKGGRTGQRGRAPRAGWCRVFASARRAPPPPVGCVGGRGRHDGGARGQGRRGDPRLCRRARGAGSVHPGASPPPPAWQRRGEARSVWGVGAARTDEGKPYALPVVRLRGTAAEYARRWGRWFFFLGGKGGAGGVLCGRCGGFLFFFFEVWTWTLGTAVMYQSVCDVRGRAVFCCMAWVY